MWGFGSLPLRFCCLLAGLTVGYVAKCYSEPTVMAHRSPQYLDGIILDRPNSAPMIDLRRYADREHLLLASYAVHSRDTGGRVHPESSHAYRGPFARDRDRKLCLGLARFAFAQKMPNQMPLEQILCCPVLQ